MATTYQVLRNQRSIDKNGNDEVFVHIEIYDDEAGLISYPKWYSGQMAKRIIEDESFLDSIITPIIPSLIVQKKIKDASLVGNLSKEVPEP